MKKLNRQDFKTDLFLLKKRVTKFKFLVTAPINTNIIDMIESKNSSNL